MKSIDVLNVPQSRRNLYRHLQAVRRHFWKRWPKECTYVGFSGTTKMEPGDRTPQCWILSSNQRRSVTTITKEIE
ncbi:hypothetical protein PPYR_06465 [Photinus pyralis]|uniref:Uncharacterized protein n=1 Tax=Photinus pyralis TaxID=7054 RepID=A0A5N4ATU1_PHOPY|nr:hypothetical protein PPYR_06465 [Photinus pyralis]